MQYTVFFVSFTNFPYYMYTTLRKSHLVTKEKKNQRASFPFPTDNGTKAKSLLFFQNLFLTNSRIFF